MSDTTEGPDDTPDSAVSLRSPARPPLPSPALPPGLGRPGRHPAAASGDQAPQPRQPRRQRARPSALTGPVSMPRVRSARPITSPQPTGSVGKARHRPVQRQDRRHSSSRP